jgi:hypothetical protein
LYRTGAVAAAIGLAVMLASCGGGAGATAGGTTAGGTTTSGATDGSTTKVPSVGADPERAGTTAKRKGPRHPLGDHAESAPQTSAEITYGPRGELTTLAAARSTAACKAKIGDLVDRMDDLRQSLLAGLDYSEYVLRVQAVRAAYEAVPVDRLALSCVAGPAGHAEDAFNQYLRAANLWGECAGTAGCAASSIESQLQHRWRIASKSLDAAKRS